MDLTPLSLYLGELFSYVRPGLLEDYWNWHVYPVHWVAGIVYLLGVGRALLFRRHEPFISLMLVIFFTINIFFLFIDPGSGLRVNHFWWASLSLIPAIVLAADGLAALWRESRRSRVIVSCLCAYLTLHLVLSDYSGGLNEPVRSAKEWSSILMKSGLDNMVHRQYGTAYDNLFWASKLDPENAALKEQLTQAYKLALRQKIKRWGDVLRFR